MLRNERARASFPAILDERGQLTFGELREEVDRRADVRRGTAGESAFVALPGTLSRDNVLDLLGALAAGVTVRIPRTTTDASTAERDPGAWDPADQRGPGEPSGTSGCTPPEVSRPAVIIDGCAGPAGHSNRSLLAAAISMATFVDAGSSGPWLSTLPLSSWEGLMAVLLPLHLGAPLVIPPQGADPDDLLGMISRHQVRYAIADLEGFAGACREAKRAAKDSRRLLSAALLAVDGPFDADQRRRVSKSLECPALTFWGMPETGPVFASHQSWYLDDSVGLPVTNAHVVPSDPRTGQPIAALWELVELAEVTVFAPSLAPLMAPESGAFAGNRFRTGMMASSDANGMIYLLGRDGAQ